MKKQDTTNGELVNELERLRRRVAELEESEAMLKGTERLLRESEERFRSLYENAPLAYQSLDEAGHFLEVNRAWLDALGYSRNEVIGQWCGNFLTASYREKFKSYFQQFKAQGEIRGVEFEMVKKDGSTVFVLADGKIGRDEQGRFKRTHCILHDVTERKREQAIMQARLRLMEHAAARSLDELLQATLDEVEVLTGSLIGFYHFLDADQRTLRLQAWSTRTLKEMCTAEGKGLHYPIDEAGVWVDCVHQRKPVIHNDYASLPHRKGMPPGHAKVIRELVVPVFRGERIVAVLGVGNKPVDYGASDIETVSLFADLAWDIAETKRAEEDLRRSEAEFIDLYENAPCAYFSVGTDGIIRLCNRRAGELLGYPREELIGKPVLDLYADTAAGKEKAGEVFKRFLAGELIADAELQMQRVDGSPAWISLTVNAIRDSQGHIVQSRSMVLDISERKRAEEALAASNRQWGLTFDAVPDLIMVVDTQHRIVRANKAMADALGMTEQELIGQLCFELVHGEKEPPAFCPHSQLLADGTEHSVDVVEPRLGAILDVRVSPLADESGRVIGSVHVARDITERQKAEAAITQQRDFLQQLIDSIPTPIFYKDREGRYLGCNRAFETDTGIPRADIAGKTVFDIAPSDFAEIYFEEDLSLLRNQGVQQGENRRQDAAGNIHYVMYTKATFSDLEGNIAGLVGVIFDITERKQAEKSLSEKSRFIDSLLRAAPVPIFYKDRDGRYIGCNDAFTEIMGVSSEDIRGKPVHELWPGELADKYHQMDLELMRNREHQEYEYLVKAKDGEIHPVIYAKDVYLDSHGEVAGIVGAFLDITQRKRAERELQQSNDLLRAIIEAAPTAIIGLDLDGNVQMVWNPAAEKMLGWSAQEAMGRPLPSVPSEGQEEFRGFRERIRSGKTLDGVEVLRQRRDGAPINYSIYASPLHDAEGRITGNVAVLVDITERKRAEERNLRLAAIVESSDDAIIGKTLDGIITTWNKGAEKIYGYTHTEAVGKPICLLVPADRKDEVPRLLARIERGEHIEHYETVRQKKDGSMIDVSLTISPIRNIEGRIISASAIARDITEEKSLQRQLIQAQKMEAIGQLAGGVAHDFNNILTAIIGYSDVLAQQIPPDSPYRDKLLQISRAGIRAAHLTRQLLAFSRKQILDLRPMDLNEVIGNFEKMLRSLIGEDIEVVTYLAPSVGTVMGDPTQIEQILLNLAVNARDAMPTGGKLTIETANVSLDEAYARTHAEVRPGPYAMLAVSDTGSGMDPQVLPRVFEPFFTTKGKEKGTGLGLSTVYGIVRQHQGHVTAYSEPDRGTTFKVYLPRVGPVPEEAAGVPAPATQLTGRETVLVVEDEDIVRELIAEVLATLGYTVFQCRDPEEAKKVSAAHGGPIHLLVTDVVLPQMDGKSLFESLSPSFPEMRVLYVSGYAENAIVHHGVLDAGVKFLQKPFSVETLAKKVREVLNSE